MSLYKVLRKSDGEEVARYGAMRVYEQIDDHTYPLTEFDHVEVVEDEPPVVSGPRRLTRLQLIARMGEAAIVAILTMAQQSAEIEAWVKMLDWATPDPDGTSIDLDDPRTIAGFTALEPLLIAQGVVEAGWAQGVLNGQ